MSQKSNFVLIIQATNSMVPIRDKTRNFQHSHQLFQTIIRVINTHINHLTVCASISRIHKVFLPFLVLHVAESVSHVQSACGGQCKSRTVCNARNAQCHYCHKICHFSRVYMSPRKQQENASHERTQTCREYDQQPQITLVTTIHKSLVPVFC